MAHGFALLDKYASARLGVGERRPKSRCIVIETERRNQPELSYGYVRVLWWLRFLGGEIVVSVPPGCGGIVERFVSERRSPEALPAKKEAAELLTLVNEKQRLVERPQAERILWDKAFACSRETMKDVGFRDECAHLERLVRKRLKYADGIWPPEHCITDGVVYGVIADGIVASVAYAHRTGKLEDCVADLGVVTNESYRRRGYAKAAVHAVTEHFTAKGGEAWYHCSPDNIASIATAISVGYVHYADSVILATRMLAA